MANPIFSLLVPTRERLSELRRFITSIAKTVDKANYYTIEILLAVDYDHQPTIDNILSIQQDFPELDIQYFLRERSEFLNGDYYNWLASSAAGDYLWVCADDLVIQEINWDIIFRKRLQTLSDQHPDKMFCVAVLDNTPTPNNNPADKCQYPCFQIFPKEVLKEVGFILPPQIATWGADKYIYWLYTKLNRLYWFEDKCYIDHRGYHEKGENPDAITIRIGEINAAKAVNPHHNILKQSAMIEAQYLQIKQYIDNYSK